MRTYNNNKEEIKNNILFQLKDEGKWYCDVNSGNLQDVIVRNVYQFGGEDMGMKWEAVYEITTFDEVFYLKVDALYNSYEGIDFSDAEIYEVQSQPKTVKVWERVE